MRPDGFAAIDWLIDRCRVHRLWVVLDLHGAPGGQTGTNIDDSPRGLPELFTERHYQEQTIELWRALAIRYRDEPVVAGYDLLNEPLPNEYQYRHADDLVALYGELTAAIRAVDPDHLIIYEGTHWASNWDIFTEVWDPKSVLQFHRYWSPPDRPGIQRYLDVRDRLGLPIYMGEGGENNLDWLQTAFQLYEDEEISWNFWPWKKIETLTSPCSVTAPTGWIRDRGVRRGQGGRPDPEDAWRTLMTCSMASTSTAASTDRRWSTRLLRRPPLRLPATGFSFRGEGQSYQTSDGEPARRVPARRSGDHRASVAASRRTTRLLPHRRRAARRRRPPARPARTGRLGELRRAPGCRDPLGDRGTRRRPGTGAPRRHRPTGGRCRRDD